jgi:hypothetical protein
MRPIAPFSRYGESEDRRDPRLGRPVAGMDRWPVLQEQSGECRHDLPFTKPGTMRLSAIDA